MGLRGLLTAGQPCRGPLCSSSAAPTCSVSPVGHRWGERIQQQLLQQQWHQEVVGLAGEGQLVEVCCGCRLVALSVWPELACGRVFWYRRPAYVGMSAYSMTGWLAPQVALT
jgi:hypothetical protein